MAINNNSALDYDFMKKQKFISAKLLDFSTTDGNEVHGIQVWTTEDNQDNDNVTNQILNKYWISDTEQWANIKLLTLGQTINAYFKLTGQKVKLTNISKEEEK